MITRFEPTQFNDSGVVERPNGAFVRYADYASLQARHNILIEMAGFLLANLDDNAILTNDQISTLAALGVLK